MELNRRRRLSADGWRAALKRFSGSGLSAREFCEREGLGLVSFYQWRTRLGARGRPAPTVKASPPVPGPQFLDLGTLGAERAKSPRMEVRLDLGGGLVLHVVRS